MVSGYRHFPGPIILTETNTYQVMVKPTLQAGVGFR
jgi:hypothetical protein